MYDGLKTNVPGFFQYFSVFLIRKLTYAGLVYYLSDKKYCMFQVMCNVYLSFLFVLYLSFFRPFIDPTLMTINFINEFCFYLTSVIYLTFTDINPDPRAKVLMGWILIVLVFGNLIFPNCCRWFFAIWPSIKLLCRFEQTSEGKFIDK